MKFNLIQEAQIRTSVTPDELSVMETAMKALGKSSLGELLEATMPSEQDYAKWLDVIEGYAADTDISITRRADFNEIAQAVLDNDPLRPAFNMRTHIVNKLWAMAKAKKHQSKIDRVAQEEEEQSRLDASVRAMRGDVTPEDIAGSDVDFGDEADLPAGKDDDCEHCGTQHAYIDDTNHCSNCGAELDNADDVRMDDTLAVDDADVEDTDSDYDIDSIVSRVMGGDVSPEFKRSERPEENEERTTAVPTSQTKSLLQHVLTGPKDTISKALKDVEAEGEAAWTSHEIPRNPHPKQSMAYRAWERGMKKAAKHQFGFDEKTQPVKRKK